MVNPLGARSVRAVHAMPTHGMTGTHLKRRSSDMMRRTKGLVKLGVK
jgi:hypothetical protein